MTKIEREIENIPIWREVDAKRDRKRDRKREKILFLKIS